jgi:hypothetical protein
MIYTLSERQRDALRRGRILHIAMPHPGGRIDDYTAWAREHLDAPTSIIEAREQVVTADLSRKLSGGLGELLGSLDTGSQPMALPVQIRCVVAEIGDVGGLLPKRPQWPASVRLANGWTLPRTK